MIDFCLIDNEWYPLDIDSRIRPIYEINTNGEVRNKFTGKIIKPHVDKDGYLKYTLQGHGKKIKHFAHRLVAMKFIYGDTTLQVNHINAKKNDNHYSNLEWVTNKENIRHSLNNKLQEFVRGSKHGNSLVTEKEVEKLCKYIVKGYSNEEIAKKFYKEFNITKEQLKSIIKHIKRKNSWRHVSDKYF